MLLIDSITKDVTPWVEAFRDHLGSDEVVQWSELENSEDVKVAVVWNHRPDLFEQLPNLELVASLGAGVDHILRDPLLPAHVPVSKVVSPHLTGPMANFCVGTVIYFHRQFDKYARDKQEKIWDQEFDPEIALQIGILGLGELGSEVARRLAFLGFEIHGLSRSAKKIEGVITYEEKDIDTFLSKINFLICLLPATPETKGVLSASLFEKMNDGSYLVNVGRGHHQVDADVLHALDSGKLKGAFLDVFPKEPLPATSPYWNHPKVFITPHIAVVTKLEAAVPQIIENYQRIKQGLPLLNLIDKQKGY